MGILIAALFLPTPLALSVGTPAHLLKSEEVKPLLAMQALYNSRDDYDVSEEQIFAYISQERIALDNPLLLEILSDPSGVEPEDAVDEDLTVTS